MVKQQQSGVVVFCGFPVRYGFPSFSVHGFVEQLLVIAFEVRDREVLRFTLRHLDGGANVSSVTARNRARCEVEYGLDLSKYRLVIAEDGKKRSVCFKTVEEAEDLKNKLIRHEEQAKAKTIGVHLSTRSKKSLLKAVSPVT